MSIRGLHFHERGQDDLFVCLQGMVRVVVLEPRERARRSPRTSGTTTPSRSTFPGIHAHGYEALTDCLFCYLVTEEYDPADPDEHRLPWNDPRVVDLWSTRSPLLSERDRSAQTLITGAGGQLGRALAERYPAAIARRRAPTGTCGFRRRRRTTHAGLVLHAAGWTNVDGAEDDPQDAAAVNVGGTQHAAELGAPFVSYSTDYVFDGEKRTPYVESDAAESARRLRPDEASRRGCCGRAGVDRPLLVALRPDRSQLRADDAPARQRTGRGRGGRRPAGRADLRRLTSPPRRMP